jgi:hypothetical protein
MEIVRQLQEPVRTMFRVANRARAGLGVGVILLVSGMLLTVGAALGVLYCQAGREREVQQLAGVTKEVLPIAALCMATLRETVGPALIFARNQPPSRPVPVATRDSLRERRWTSP